MFITNPAPSQLRIGLKAALPRFAVAESQVDDKKTGFPPAAPILIMRQCDQLLLVATAEGGAT